MILVALFGGATYVIRSEVADMRSDVATLKNGVNNLKNDLTSKDQSTNQRIDGLLRDALERAFPRPTGSKSDVKGSLSHVDRAVGVRYG